MHIGIPELSKWEKHSNRLSYLYETASTSSTTNHMYAAVTEIVYTGAEFSESSWLVPSRLLWENWEEAKDDGKDKRRETTGRSCFQDGGRSNGGFEIKIKAIERERVLAPYHKLLFRDTSDISDFLFIPIKRPPIKRLPPIRQPVIKVPK